MVNKLIIPKSEVLRYLGHKNQIISENLDSLVEQCIEECKKLIMPKFIKREYNISLDKDGVNVVNTNLVFKGEDIKKHLQYAEKIVLMAATLGNVIEKKIAYYEKVDMTKAVILDSCATTAIEEVCDFIDIDIKKEALRNNKGTTFRYSPGYGDLPLDVQGDLLNTLQAGKIIGLNVSAHNILLPRKSVTAIIGIVPIDKNTQKRTCEVCANYATCNFRKEGVTCGN